MRRLSRRRRGGCLTEAGAGGVDGPLDAVGESGADHSAEHGAAVEGAGADGGNGAGDSRGIADQGDDRQQQIAYRHEGDDNGGDGCDPADAAGDH